MTQVSNKSRVKMDHHGLEDDLSIESRTEVEVEELDSESRDEGTQISKGSGNGGDLAEKTVHRTSYIFVSEDCC